MVVSFPFYVNLWNTLTYNIFSDNMRFFGSIFGDMINSVAELEDNYMKQQYLLSTGQLDDPHSVPIALTICASHNMPAKAFFLPHAKYICLYV